MNNNFVTFAIGERRSVHRQANFAVLSILARSPEAAPPAIHIVTDDPSHYRWLERHVTIVPVDSRILAEWTGPHRFFWRIKLCAMQHVMASSAGNLIYVDSDIVCRTALRSLFEALEAGAAFMHKLEYSLHAKGGRAGKLWKKGGGKRFGRFEIDEGSRMWNAGVVALPGNLAGPRVADALECTDAMSAAGIGGLLIEQFSLSQSLDRNGDLRAAEPWFIHYWGNKTPWNALIAGFLSDALVRGMSVEEICAQLRELELTLPEAIPRTRLERFNNSVRKVLFPRDERVVSQLTSELAD
jgi:hypothetical protein